LVAIRVDKYIAHRHGGAMSEDAPLKADSTGPSDPYESEFMSGGGEVLHRDKITSPWWLQAALGLGVVGAIVGGAFAVKDGAPLLFFPFLAAWIAFVWANIYALRVSVTQDKVHVQYGLFGPRIRVEDIVLCEAQQYNAMLKYGGWGIKYSLSDGSWAFNMPGDGGSGVMIHYKTSGGGVRKVFVSSHHPAVLADAVNRARAAKGHHIDGLLDDADLGLDDDVLYTEIQHGQPEALESTEPGGEASDQVDIASEVVEEQS
jgi:hypothetical protein